MKRLISIVVLIFSVLFIFNLCFFICVDYDGNDRAWICYSFCHLSYLLSLVGYFFTTHRRFIVLNERLNAISIIYLTITTITCLWFLAYPEYSIALVFFVFLIELLFYLLTFHYCQLTNRKAESGVIKDLKSSSKHESWIAELRLLIKTTDEREKANVLTSVVNELSSSPSLSNSNVYEVDNEIQSMIRSLKSNYTNIPISELLNWESRIKYAIRKRTELLKNSCHKI